MVAILVDDERQVGARPHETHVALDDVEEVGQLVEAQGAHPATARRDARVLVGQVIAAELPGVGDHRTELVDAERDAAEPDAVLDEQHWRPARGAHDDGERAEQRRESQGGWDGHSEVDESLAVAPVETARRAARRASGGASEAGLGGALESGPQALAHDVAVELALRQTARVRAHAGRRRRLVGERSEGGCQGETVTGRHVQARRVSLDEAAQPAVEVDDGGPAGGQRVEELVGRIGLEGRVGCKERQGGVGSAHDGGQAALGHGCQESQVVEA